MKNILRNTVLADQGDSGHSPGSAPVCNRSAFDQTLTKWVVLK